MLKVFSFVLLYNMYFYNYSINCDQNAMSQNACIRDHMQTFSFYLESHCTSSRNYERTDVTGFSLRAKIDVPGAK